MRRRTTIRPALAGLVATLPGCAPVARYHMPSSLRGYAVVVPSTDSLTRALRAAFRRHGFVVLTRPKGGAGPTAALIHFSQRQPGAASSVLHVQLADTRTGVVVGAVVVVLDSLPAGHAAQAEAILDSLGLGSHPLEP